MSSQMKQIGQNHSRKKHGFLVCEHQQQKLVSIECSNNEFGDKKMTYVKESMTYSASTSYSRAWRRCLQARASRYLPSTCSTDRAQLWTNREQFIISPFTVSTGTSGFEAPWYRAKSMYMYVHVVPVPPETEDTCRVHKNYIRTGDSYGVAHFVLHRQFTTRSAA